MLLQILVVSDPKVATEVLQMPKIMDKNRQALVTLDTVSLSFVISWPEHMVRPAHVTFFFSEHIITHTSVCMTADKPAW